jgi:hypothetical protein
MKKIALVFAVLFLNGCASQCGPKLETAEKPEIFADSVNRAQLIGTWLGESPVKDGSSVKFITQRGDDGSMKIHFRISSPKEQTRDQVEVGFWGISGGVYFTLTRGMLQDGHVFAVNTKDSTYYDAYRAVSISPSEFKYKSLSTQEEFIVKRVTNDFKF